MALRKLKHNVHCYTQNHCVGCFSSDSYAILFWCKVRVQRHMPWRTCCLLRNGKHKKKTWVWEELIEESALNDKVISSEHQLITLSTFFSCLSWMDYFEPVCKEFWQMSSTSALKVIVNEAAKFRYRSGNQFNCGGSSNKEKQY